MHLTVWCKRSMLPPTLTEISTRSLKRENTNMNALWVILLLLHRGYTLIPVTTVQLGEPATLLCDLPKTVYSRRVDWYKQSPGDTLQRIWTVKDSAAPAFAPEFNNSKWDVKYDKNLSKLTILRTRQEDEGMYHCGFTEWLQDTKWTATYLLVKGNTQKTSNYSVVQKKIAPPGGSVTLHCSLLSNFDNKTCSGGLSMFWFREGSNPSHPSIIYTDGNRHHKCGSNSATQQSCVYQFNKSISSSEEGTYYCAVATCGKILFGKGTKLQVPESSVWSQSATTVIFLLCPVLVLIVIAVLAYTIKKTNSDYCKATILEKNSGDFKRQQEKDTSVFSAVIFIVIQDEKNIKAVKRQQISMNFGPD
ncbi:uncharacterized protein LOC120720415 [Simochromis diagramma]|uniref:uncharacterized protein LOC120720415 n=1 Tax=Simochromis diagramma TaxID=43689 RepID=UPI001A7F0E28|nr:uncharacterized protein LOC120720415 [Simochromis diagramma]